MIVLQNIFQCFTFPVMENVILYQRPDRLSVFSIILYSSLGLYYNLTTFLDLHFPISLEVLYQFSLLFFHQYGKHSCPLHGVQTQNTCQKLKVQKEEVRNRHNSSVLFLASSQTDKRNTCLSEIFPQISLVVTITYSVTVHQPH